MASRRIEERFAFSGGTIDRTGEYPVVRGVLLCGPESKNRRRYKAEAFAGDRVKKYEGRPINIGHIDPRKSRLYSEQIGWIEKAYHRADGMPLGDIAVKPKHPLAETFLWDAEHRPSSAGMSHVAQCSTEAAKDGWDDVRELQEVESVDLVLDPASVKNFYENQGPQVSRKLNEWVESFCRNPKATVKQILTLKSLSEEMGDYSAPEGDGETMDAGQGVHDAFLTAAMHICSAALKGEMDHAEAGKKLKKLMGTHKDVNGPADDAGDESAEKDGGEKAADDKADDKEEKKESVAQSGPDYPAILAECADLSYSPGPMALRALASFSEKADRAKFISEQRAMEPGDKVKSAARKPGSSTAGTVKSEQVDNKPVPTEGKAFAESIRVR
jgi:hypothetical protein